MAVGLTNASSNGSANTGDNYVIGILPFDDSGAEVHVELGFKPSCVIGIRNPSSYVEFPNLVYDSSPEQMLSDLQRFFPYQVNLFAMTQDYDVLDVDSNPIMHIDDSGFTYFPELLYHGIGTDMVFIYIAFR